MLNSSPQSIPELFEFLRSKGVTVASVRQPPELRELPEDQDESGEVVQEVAQIQSSEPSNEGLAARILSQQVYCPHQVTRCSTLTTPEYETEVLNTFVTHLDNPSVFAGVFDRIEEFRVATDTCRTQGLDESPKSEMPVDVGRKFDNGKPDYSLVPAEVLEEVVKVLTWGATKYDRDNWKKVPYALPRYFAAAQRHIWAIQKGEQRDPESGFHHLAHAICCLMFFMALDKE